MPSLTDLYERLQAARRKVETAHQEWCRAEEKRQNAMDLPDDPLDILLEETETTPEAEAAEEAYEAYRSAFQSYEDLHEQWTSHAECRKCGGSGSIPGYEHVANGQCFRCGGSGTDPEVRGRDVITPQRLRHKLDRKNEERCLDE